MMNSIKVRIRQWWYRLYIRKDESHTSLDIDLEYIDLIGEENLDDYFNELAERTAKAHSGDIA